MKNLFLAVASALSCLVPSAYAGHRSDPIGNLHTVGLGIWRSARPTYEGLKVMASRGVTTVIDLENIDSVVAQEKKWAEKLGLTFISRPMDSFEPVDEREVNEILDMLSDPMRPGILIHCMGGMDRTGFIVGLYRVLHNAWQPADAYAEMLKYGFHHEYDILREYFQERTGWDGPSLRGGRRRK